MTGHRLQLLRRTVLVLALLAATASDAAVLWSEIAARIGADDCLRVPPGGTLLIDGDATLGRLDVQGTLEFQDLGPRSLEVSEVRVTGAFNVGSEASPFANDLEIRLVGTSSCRAEHLLAELHVPVFPPTLPVPGSPPPTRRIVVLLALAAGTFPALAPDDERTILVLDDGQLRMHGSDPGLTWTTLTRTAPAAATAMRVPAGTGWSRGDRVVLAPTDYAHDQADEAGLSLGPLAIAGVEIWGLDTALLHEHHAQRIDDVPVFGEVGKLNRNVKVFSPSPAPVGVLDRDCTNEGYTGTHLEFNGAEIRVERPNGGSANAVLEFIEVYNAGKFDRLGHYPIHFHMIGDGAGARVRGVSVHTSANRGIVAHGTTDVEVLENVVHDVVGHGYYLEEAGAMATLRNRLEGNLAVQVHGCPIENDAADDVQFADDVTSSGFFFTDPRNALVDNHAAGAFHAGFWWDGGNEFNGWNLCGGRSLHADGVHAEPLDTNLFADTTEYTSATVYLDADLSTTCHGAFVGNSAHSAAKGVWAEQHKDQLVRFSELTIYKNRTRALELKNHGVTEIHDLRASDNPVTLWPATHAFHTNDRPRVLLVDSVVQGESLARSTVSFPFGDAAIPFYGIEVYEGRLDVARTAFHGFDDSDPAKGKRAAFGRHQMFPFYSNNPDSAIEDVTFGAGVNALYFDEPTSETRPDRASATVAGASGFQSVMLRDLGGDITGVPGQWIVANDEFNIPNAASGMQAAYDARANAWFIDDDTWVQGQLLVEWCAEFTTLPAVGDPRCEWFDGANEAVPARRWNLVNANGDDFDIVDEVRFVDLDDCTGPGCPDEIDAKHHRPQGNHNIAAANARAPGSYGVAFHDAAGVELDAGNPAFDEVRAIQVHWRNAPPGSSINVDVAVPDEPSCVVLYNDMGMPAGGHEVTWQIATGGAPATPQEWSYDGLGTVSLMLEHGDDEQSVLLVFDDLVTCPS